MIVYFSGTGNSRYCAQMLAHNLGDELLDCANYIRHQIAADLISGKPWVFVSPTYAWRLPRIFAEFIRSGSFSGSTDKFIEDNGRKLFLLYICPLINGSGNYYIEARTRSKEIFCPNFFQCIPLNW